MAATRGAGNLRLSPLLLPDPDLNPRSASCQPGCSQADIAAGAFGSLSSDLPPPGTSKEEPEVSLLQPASLAALKQSPGAPRGLPGEGNAAGRVCVGGSARPDVS